MSELGDIADENLFGDNEQEEQQVTEPQTAQTFDQVVDSLKKRKSRKDDDTGMYSQVKEEFAKYLIQQMRSAAADDFEAIQQGKPALNRIALIDHVCKEAIKPNFQDSLLSLGLLGCIREWLEPNRLTGEIAPLTIRSKLIDLLSDLDIEIDSVVNCALGATLLRNWQLETDLIVKNKCEILILKLVNMALTEAGDEDPNARASEHAAQLARSFREADEAAKAMVGSSTRYANAPARIFTRRVLSTVHEDPQAAMNLRMQKKVRAMRKRP